MPVDLEEVAVAGSFDIVEAIRAIAAIVVLIPEEAPAPDFGPGFAGPRGLIEDKSLETEEIIIDVEARPVAMVDVRPKTAARRKAGA